MSSSQSHVHVDLSHEQSASVLSRARPDPRAWIADEIEPRECIVHLDDASRGELARMAEIVEHAPLPIVLRTPAQFETPALGAIMARAKTLLDSRPGVAVVDRLPLDELDVETAKALFWILGHLLARPVAQRWDGTMLYDVRDTGKTYGYGVRGSYTNVELVFHNDNAFAIAPPHYVGLLCLHPAMEGGVSRFCSVHALHDTMQRRYPRELERLYRCMIWDRQAEHAPGEPKTLLAPMFSHRDGELWARVNVSLVRKGYEVAGVEPDAELETALAALEEVAADRTLWFELPIERGQLQYLNNRQIVHYRSRFTDYPDPARKRHLVRTWHRDEGLPTYDG